MYAIIDGAKIASRDELHDALARALSLPEWYGRNLDALFDCLTDIREDTDVLLLRADRLEASLGNYASVLRTVLREACEENPHLHLLTAEEGV